MPQRKISLCSNAAVLCQIQPAGKISREAFRHAMFSAKVSFLFITSCRWCVCDVLMLKCNNQHLKWSLLFPSTSLHLPAVRSSFYSLPHPFFYLFSLTFSQCYRFLSQPLSPLSFSRLTLFLPLPPYKTLTERCPILDTHSEMLQRALSGNPSPIRPARYEPAALH